MPEIDKMYLEAQKALEQEEYELAISYLQRCLEFSPHFVKAREKLAEIYYLKGDYSLAIDFIMEIYDKGIKFSNMLHLILGRCYFKLSKYKEAFSEYKFVLADAINLSYVDYCNLGYVYNKIGNSQESLQYYHRAYQLNSNGKTALFNLGLSYFKMGDYSRSYDFFEKSYQFMEDNTDINNKLGVLSIVLKKDEHEAEKFFKKALSKNNNYLPAMYNYIKIINYFTKDYVLLDEYMMLFRKFCMDREKVHELEKLITYDDRQY